MKKVAFDELVTSITADNRRYIWNYRYASKKTASATIEVEGKKKCPVIRIDGTPANAEKEASDEASDIHNIEKSIVSEYGDKKLSLIQSLHRQLYVIGISPQIAIQWDFPITFEMARAFQKANGRYLRENQWTNITLVMSLELG